jgi:hypothetical protein
MEQAAKKLVLKMEGAVIQLEGIIKGLNFVASALPDCPHEIDCEGLSALLMSMFIPAQDAIEAIKKICELTDEDTKKIVA